MIRLLRLLVADARNDFALTVLDVRNFFRAACGKPRICWDCKKREAADGFKLCRECAADWACT